jgi:threonine synthase
MSSVKGLRCRECQNDYPIEPQHVCELCFGPLEAVYDYKKAREQLSKKIIESRPESMWRYKELLPIDKDPTVGLQVGFTPLIKANRLAKALGVNTVWVKNDAVNYPTLSFKDRVVGVALSKAREFGFDTVACASTGNLANSVAANAASAGFACNVFIPSDLERGKIVGSLIYGANVIGIKGTYDEVNRLCSEIANKYNWAFVNINIRPYYAEGSKTLGYEVMEQLGWTTPDHFVVPMASGSLLTKIEKSVKEFKKLGLIKKDCSPKVNGAQATGCSPISRAFKDKMDFYKPVKPDTICKSLAIGNPADGFYGLQAMRNTGGVADDVTDDELVDGIKLLAETEGIFAETAGGVTVAVTKKLIEQGQIKKNETVVILNTGNGLKTQEAIDKKIGKKHVIGPNINEVDALLKKL